MKKLITLSFLTYTLFSSTTSLGMLQRTTTHIRKNPFLSKHTAPTHRNYFITRIARTLPPKNIFNASARELSENNSPLLEDLNNRNSTLTEKLEFCCTILNEQIDILTDHTAFGEPLELEELRSLEGSLQYHLKEIQTHIQPVPKKSNGHANE